MVDHLGETDSGSASVAHWVVYRESDQLRFFEYDGSPLLETTAGKTANALGVPVEQLHHKLRAMVDSGRAWRWDAGTFTFCRTNSRSDLSRYHAAKIGFFRHGKRISQAADNEPAEVDLDDVDLSEAQYDFMEN